MPAALDKVTDFHALVDYLRDELEWPIAADIGLDEATYDVTPEEIGLKSSVVGGGIEIKQLRPLNRAQPWGVFFLNLPSAKLPVTLVRNILGKLAIKKRASANKSEQAAFAKHDLLFIAATGSVPDRRLAFAHFADNDVMGDAATLQVLGWDADDTPRRLGLTEASLKTKLHWPDDPTDVDGWRKQWGEAFAHADTRTVVRESKQMAKELAALARRIRDRAKELIAAQTANGSLVKLHKAFKEALIHDLTPEGFADTYAQTIAYGLLSTAISRASGALTQDDMAANVAGTSPFLKEMLGTFIEAGGRKTGKAQGLDFDELGITDVVELLRNADMEAVLADFDRNNPDEDPVIHFYELFLKEYDAAQKMKRGVFYTPRPVVGFIVRSVDEVLRVEFELKDGLASTATWREVIAASEGKDGTRITLPEGANEDDPFVRILDPATGTGTFLVECVDLIYKTMVKKWKGAGKRDAEIRALWNAYVPDHLLPRLYGFELLMAPYAIAHVKLGLKLADTGYAFGSDARAQIYLTNALEPAQDMAAPQFDVMDDALAHESKAARAAKLARFTVVLGNPPYKGESANPSKDKRGRLTPAGKLIQHYFLVDGVQIDEENVKWINNDYVKFLGFAEAVLRATGVGVLGYITSNSWLDGPIFIGLRARALEVYPLLAVVDCHGNVSRKEKADDGTKDKGVFEISEGTNITVGVIGASQCEIRHVDLLGTLKSKYEWFHSSTISSREVKNFKVALPKRLLVKTDQINAAEFDGFVALNIALPEHGVGMATARDHLTIHFSLAELESTIDEFVQLDPETARERFDLGEDARDWKVYLAQRDLRTNPVERTAQTVFYRPFDRRWTAYSGQTKGFICMPKAELLGKMIGGQNLGLVSSRLAKGEKFAHVAVTRDPTEAICLSPTTSNNGYLFPLWLKLQGTETRTLPNIDSAFAARIAALTGLTYDDCAEGPRQGALDGILPKKAEQTAMFAPGRRERGEPGKSFGPRDLFDYIYAVLHSPAYRARYADYLKSDFARVPLPGSRALFEAIVPLGTQLVALQLLDDALPILENPKGIRLAGSGEARVAHKPEYDPKLGRVMINATRWFEHVPAVAWDFYVGGYQPAQKWLKDRAARGGKKARPGRVLADDDILHYRRMIVALTHTAELMPQIDTAVKEHGGWPGAFVSAGSATRVQLPALATLPDGSWTWPSSIQPRDRLRYAAQYALWQMDPANDASRLRFVIASLAEPALLTPLLSDNDRAAWLRLIGTDARSSMGVVRLRPEVNGAWRAMFETMITSGQLTEQPDGSWSRGAYFSEAGLNAVSVDAQRVAFVLHAVRMIGVESLEAAVTPGDNVIWARFGNG